MVDQKIDLRVELSRRHATGIKCFLDESEGVVTFYLHGIISKRLLGYQVYNPNSNKKKTNTPRESRYYTYQRSAKDTGEHAVFGLEYIRDAERSSKLFVTEGVFEAARLINLGYNALAILTSNPPKSLITQLHTISDNIIWCGDNDQAGKKSALAKYPCMFFDQDLDEVPEEELTTRIHQL